MKVYRICLLSILLPAGLFFSASSFGQQTIQTMSFESEVAGNFYHSSIGEMMLVETYTSGDFIFTQGFLQPAENTIISVAENTAMADALHVFPNPFQQWVQIELMTGSTGNFEIEIIDASGRLVHSEQLLLAGARTAHSIDMSAYSAGYYILKATSLENTTNKTYISRLIKN